MNKSPQNTEVPLQPLRSALEEVPAQLSKFVHQLSLFEADAALNFRWRFQFESEAIGSMRNLFFALALSFALSGIAAAKELHNLDRNGIAIQGYDPVAFFTDNRPVKGTSQFQSEYRGAKYYFASADHKAVFDKEPAKYEPQFGGYCAYGASKGQPAPVKIEAWQIVNGRLLMQYDLGVRDTFNKDQQGNLSKADQHWPGIVEKYGQ